MFDITTSAKFNRFVSTHQLIEQKLNGRKYTWNNGNRFALLDRFFTSLSWENIYPASSILDLGKYGSDHCPLILQISSKFDSPTKLFRFDPLWLDQPDFILLINKWWHDFPLDNTDIAKSWNAKLKFLRQKIRGWTKNFYSKKKREK